MSDIISAYYKLVINGVPLDDFRMDMIQDITLEESSVGSDVVRIQISDPNFIFIEDNVFVEDATVVYEMGIFEDSFRHKFKGYISAIDINFPEEGSPNVTLTCMDNTHLMNRKKKKRNWKGVKASDVIRKIIAEYGFKSVIEESDKVYKTLTQSKNTDIEFIVDLTKKEPEKFMCYIEEDTFYFKRKKLIGNPQDTLYYRQEPYDIKSFSPKITKEMKQSSVDEQDINEDKSLDSGSATQSKEVQGEPVNNKSRRIASAFIRGADGESGSWQDVEERR